jgi:hypothetical protein
LAADGTYLNLPNHPRMVTGKFSGIESFEQLPKKKNATNQKFIAF